MNIGIDLDGVLFDTESRFRTLSTIVNIEKYKSEEVNREEVYFQKRFRWTEQQEYEFYLDCYEDIEMNAPLMPYADVIIDKLKKMGHKLYIITARGYSFEHEKEITEKRFKECGLTFDGVFFASHNKAEICKKAKIDLMIDDIYENIDLVSKSGVRCLYFRDLVLKQFDKSENYVHEVRNWGDIYSEILDFENWKL